MTQIRVQYLNNKKQNYLKKQNYCLTDFLLVSVWNKYRLIQVNTIFIFLVYFYLLFFVANIKNINFGNCFRLLNDLFITHTHTYITEDLTYLKYRQGHHLMNHRLFRLWHCLCPSILSPNAVSSLNVMNGFTVKQRSDILAQTTPSRFI